MALQLTTEPLVQLRRVTALVHAMHDTVAEIRHAGGRSLLVSFLPGVDAAITPCDLREALSRTLPDGVGLGRALGLPSDDLHARVVDDPDRPRHLAFGLWRFACHAKHGYVFASLLSLAAVEQIVAAVTAEIRSEAGPESEALAWGAIHVITDHELETSTLFVAFALETPARLPTAAVAVRVAAACGAAEVAQTVTGAP